jgi:hypothetical protein
VQPRTMEWPKILDVIPAHAGIQKISLDTGLRRYDDWNSDTHLRGVVLRLAL